MEFITVGKILKPQGVKGELKIKPMLDEQEKLSTMTHCYIGKNNEEYHVVKCDVRFGYAYLTLENVFDRNQAELFRNKELKITREQFGSLDENSYLVDDLVGMDVFDNKTNAKIGTLVDVEQYGAADVFIIYTDGRKWQIPFINDVFPSVDVLARKIYVNVDLFKEMRVCE